jgi:flagellar basal-body rod modification protein FlgD
VDTLLAIEASNQAVGLIGKSVEVRSIQGNRVGTVKAISFATGEPRLTIDSSGTSLVDVRLSDVTLIR